MAQLLMILQGPNRKKWIIALMMLTAVALGALEVWHPGTLASIPSFIASSALQLYRWMGNVVDAFRELVRDITGWYG